MRNWNIISSGVIPFPSLFGSYLWGIETISSQSLAQIEREFGSYLWGIETCNGCNFRRGRVRLDRTYEELKLRSAHMSRLRRSRLDRTYEELKQNRIYGKAQTAVEVWIVPMRNWNYISCTLISLGSTVWIVPMRNWNLSCIDWTGCPAPSLDRTYEELKLSIQRRNFLRCPCLDRTYEELKQVIVAKGRNTGVGFGSYLWGIETISSQSLAQIERDSLDRTYKELKHSSSALVQCTALLCLDRTYEELKLSLPISTPPPSSPFGSYLWGIETATIAGWRSVWPSLDRTYEELKLLFREKREAKKLGLDRTYEELKLCIPTGRLRTCESVWIVPMRNWNYHTPSCKPHSPNVFGSYLWGIETRMMDGKVFRLSEGLDRTYEELKPAARVWGIVWRASLDRTYEELKQVRNKAQQACCLVWIVPMRNWNRLSIRSSRFRRLVWIVPMRNWNTDTGLMATNRLRCLDRTYEELKPTLGGSHSYWGWPVWIVPMRNWNRRLNGWLMIWRHVWIVPMRNWNSHRRSRWPSRSAEFGSYLWGIETEQFDLSIGMLIRFGSYLWGIETFLRRSRRSFAFWVWIVPMRNWNLTDPRYFNEVLSLDRTYEELKPNQSFHGPANVRRLDRTYEELKLIAVFQFCGDCAEVWIVPMRNWNRPRSPAVGFPAPVWIVPMRNWNSVGMFLQTS